MLTVHLKSFSLLTLVAGALAAANIHPPVSFEPNRGQLTGGTDFFARGKLFSLSLSAGRMDWIARDARITSLLEGASRAARPIGEAPQPGVMNYPAQHVSGIPTYGRIRYRSIYPGVDLVVYGQQGRLEYDFIVAPGSDPSRIRMRYQGAKQLRLTDEGDLLVEARAGALRQPRPLVYQEIDGARREVTGGYRLRGSRVSFELGPYDHTRPLVIDPPVTWASYLGGANVYSNGESMALDSAGNIYVGGTIVDQYGGASAFVSKISPDGSTLAFTSSLIGNRDVACHAITVDGNGNIILAGDSDATNFPSAPPLFSYPSTADRVGKAWIAKLDPTGQTTIFSGYLGGTYSDISLALTVDPSNNVYVAGGTYSPDYPVTPNAAQPTLAGTLNAFLTKLDPNGNRLYSTFWGGADLDTAFGVALDPAGNIYLGGDTQSDNFPLAGTPYQGYHKEDNDTFVTKFSPDGKVVYSTLLGGSGYDSLCAIAVDASGFVYVAGVTTSKDFPTVNAVQPKMAGVSDLFIARLDSSGSTLLYSTYLGGSGLDATTSMTVDGAGNLYVSGLSKSTDFPLRDAFQKTNPAPMNGVVAALDRTGALLFSSYLGGSGDPDTKIGDSANYIAINCAGGLVVMGDTVSVDFPATASSFEPTYHGIGDAFVAKVASGGNPAINPAGVVNAANLTPGPVAPGSVVSVLGQGLALATQQASTSPAPMNLAGTAVLVNGNPAPILSAAYDRVDVQLPKDIVAGSASLAVTVPCGTTPVVSFSVAPTAPYIAMAFHSDGTPVTADSPVDPGTAVIIALTGVGTADNPAATANVGGFDATLQSLAPTASGSGWFQAKVMVPAGLSAGSYPVVLTINGVTSNSAPVFVQ